jgi:hypothetical protein
MGDREPFCFLAAAMPGQSHQRRQDHWERPATDEQSSQHRPEDGGHQLTGKQHVSGSAVPSTENQTRPTHCHQGHGRQAGTSGLTHAALRNEIGRSRSRTLSGATPQTANQASQVQCRQARIPPRRGRGGVTSDLRDGVSREMSGGQRRVDEVNTGRGR